MPARYASDTEVPVERSKRAIEILLIAHGATEYATGWDQTHDRIQFRLFNRTVRFVLPRPDLKDKVFTHDKRGYRRADGAIQRMAEQADRQCWRALYLVIRAKIEAVEAGIAVFEQEFLAFIVVGNDLTVGDILVPRIQAGEVLMLEAGS